mmetsp:Transcript_19329/g.39667  ORF Transcript_19329/g.39667 Transcript_19329/m.39667 type:complete len:207 (+) Transcript_19329:1662-2282(+)
MAGVSRGILVCLADPRGALAQCLCCLREGLGFLADHPPGLSSLDRWVLPEEPSGPGALVLDPPDDLHGDLGLFLFVRGEVVVALALGDPRAKDLVPRVAVDAPAPSAEDVFLVRCADSVHGHAAHHGHHGAVIVLAVGVGTRGHFCSLPLPVCACACACACVRKEKEFFSEARDGTLTNEVVCFSVGERYRLSIFDFRNYGLFYGL